jgi:hypothetical protein
MNSATAAFMLMSAAILMAWWSVLAFAAARLLGLA